LGVASFLSPNLTRIIAKKFKDSIIKKNNPQWKVEDAAEAKRAHRIMVAQAILLLAAVLLIKGIAVWAFLNPDSFKGFLHSLGL